LSEIDNAADDASQLINTTTTNGNDSGDVNGRSRVYHHKIQIAGRSQSPPTSFSINNNNNEGPSDSQDTRYSYGSSRDLSGTRTLQGLSPSRSMDLAQKSNTYKPILTQGDQLNRIKVIRKRNKHHKGGVFKEPNVNSASPNFAGSYPKLGYGSGSGKGSVLDFREIYNIHDPETEDGFSTTESSDIEAYNRFCYETENPSPTIYRVLPGIKGTNASPNNGTDINGQELNNGDSMESQLSTSTALSGRDSLSSSYPRTLTPVNLPLIGLGSRMPSENNVRALRARGISTRGYEDLREIDNVNGGGVGGGGTEAVSSPSRPGMNPTIIPVNVSRGTQQNNRMLSVTRTAPQKMTVTRDTPCVLRASYPDASDSNTSSTVASSTIPPPPSRKRVDFASHSSLLPLLNSNSLPVNKTREPFYQRSYQLPFNGNANGNGNVDGVRNGNGNNSSGNKGVDDNGYYPRTYRTYRNGDYPILRTNGNRAPSPAPSSNQVTRHQVRSSSLKTHAPPIANSPVVYADIQTNPPPQFDYRPRANDFC
uniref:SH2 domain-containing protein n=1 Tax=Hymenolepis diminuta TaxID=6216 RepID=A0A158QFY8_HYMDI